MRIPRIFFDLDKSVGDFIPWPEPHEWNVLIAGLIQDMFEKLRLARGVEGVILTDKPCGPLIGILPSVVGNTAGKFQFGESGGAVLKNGYHRRYNPLFAKWRSEVREPIKEALQAAGVWWPEVGDKVLCITVVNDWTLEDAIPGQAFADEVMRAVNCIPAGRRVSVRAGEDGNIVTITPPGFSKQDGVEWIQKVYSPMGMYGHQYETNWEKSIWIGDSAADIPAAEAFSKLGVNVASVGNGAPEYKACVRAKGRKGFVAQGYVVSGFLECLAWYRDKVLCVTPGQTASGTARKTSKAS